MKYKIIYADPPWNFKVWSQKGKEKSAENHYSVMDKKQIQLLDVSAIAEKDSILFLWATFPNLPEALELIKAWGFVYKTVAFVWVKKNKKAVDSNFWGLGYWTRSNAEICLLATRGKISRVSKSVHQVIETPVEAHSKKPGIVKAKILQLMGEMPRVELFARTKTPGWDVFGNEVKQSIEIPFKK